MKLKYVPSIIFTIIELGVVVAVLDSAKYTGDSMVIAALVLLYAVIRTSAMNVGQLIGNQTMFLANQLIQIKARIKEDEDMTDEREELKSAQENLNQTNIKLGIRGVGIVIIYIMALLALME